MSVDEYQTKSQTKGEKGRENFGVWQLPLFNLLEPECMNCDNFSGI